VTATVTTSGTTYTQTTTSVSTILSTYISTICTRCIAPTTTASPSSPAPASSTAGPLTTEVVPVPVYTTEIIYQTTTVCPVTATVTTSGTTYTQTTTSISTILSTYISTVTPSTMSTTVVVPVSVSSIAAAVPATSPAAPAPNAPCPDLLPKCLNTWIFSTGCADNADHTCYCKNTDFTANVMGCVVARGGSSAEQASALSYLAGICAPFIAQNPGLITNVPSSITLAPTAAPTGIVTASVTNAAAAVSSMAPAPTVPVTTITLHTVVTVPCSASGTVIPSSSTTTTIHTVVTVPAVHFDTQTAAAAAGATAAPSVGLAAGSPSPVAASPTSVPTGTVAAVASSVKSTAAPVATGAGITPFQGAAVNVHAKGAVVALIAGGVALLML